VALRLESHGHCTTLTMEKRQRVPHVGSSRTYEEGSAVSGEASDGCKGYSGLMVSRSLSLWYTAESTIMGED
jgi:hypothetical protein